MLAGALGLPRGWQADAQNDWLNELDILVRVDREGRIERDFHTVGAPNEAVAEARRHERLARGVSFKSAFADWVVPNGNGTKWSVKKSTTMPTDRYYIADAEFIIAIAHPDEDKLRTLAEHVNAPVFMNYLGRKAFSPTFPFYLGVFPAPAIQILRELATSAEQASPWDDEPVNTATRAVHRIVSAKNPVTENVSVPTTTDPLTDWAAYRDSLVTR